METNKISLLGKQIGKFSLVGVINTIIDIGILNFLVKVLNFKSQIKIGGFSFLLANIISVTIAMINSYILNKYWTFEAKKKKNLFQEALKFFFITILGMYFLHQLVFNLFYSYWLWPTNQLINLMHLLRINFLDELIKLNLAKVIAIGVSLIWNFLGYKIWVFKK